jgi:cold shock CspA family protein
MGVITGFIPERGFGFLTDDFSERIFVHASNILNCDPSQVRAGMSATFEVVPAAKGPTAERVVVLGI